MSFGNMEFNNLVLDKKSNTICTIIEA
jgi:hypothetical protein